VAIFPIRTYPDPVLRLSAAAVGDIGPDIRRLVDDMIETMYAAPGVGLAAPQIGVSLRVFVFDAGEGAKPVINPHLEETSGEYEYEEGCLVPEHTVRARCARAGVDRGRGREGEEVIGRVVQHESDHLDGILLLGRLGRRERKQALRDLRLEAMERGEA
jgi:peptide deformylase